MRTFDCFCGNTLFFENHRCLKCSRDVGWCPVCRDLIAVDPKQGSPKADAQQGAPPQGSPAEPGNLDPRAPPKGSPQENPPLAVPGGAHPGVVPKSALQRVDLETVEIVTCTVCGTDLQRCANNRLHDICNRYIQLPAEPDDLCVYCSLTRTIPNLSQEGNQRRWYQLETAKRRLLYTLDTIRLPYRLTEPKLIFDFKGDLPSTNVLWRMLGKKVQVYTGHAAGTITINIAEADPEKREKLRVDFREAQRTLVGHFHHEIGHFYWMLYVKDQWQTRFVELFGNHESPSYADALERYYSEGPLPNWEQSYVSAYATMHPWEDFAETFGVYLDMAAVVDTAEGFAPDPTAFDVATCSFEAMFDRYARLGIVLNEMNRTLGLIDYLPDPLSIPVKIKLEYIHDLVRSHQVWTDLNAGPRRRAKAAPLEP